MENLAKVMKEASARLGRKVTQTEIAKHCGVTQGHLSNVILDRQKASEDLLKSIADYLCKVDPSHAYSVEEISPSTSLNSKIELFGQPAPINLSSQQMVSMPEVVNVPDGNLAEITTGEVVGWHLFPKSQVGEAQVIFKAKGDGMMPSIQAGDLLFVAEAQSSDVKDKDVIIADIDGVLGCRRIAQYDNLTVLTSDNPAHRPIHIGGGQTVKIVGKVVGLYRVF